MTGAGSTTLRRYNVRNAKGRWLADIVISDDGFFATVSDYGNYAYAWTHAGDCFRSFLFNTEADYLVSKLKPGYVYAGDKTILSVKEHILSRRRTLDMSASKARAEWYLLDAYNNLGDANDFGSWLESTNIRDAYELACSERDPQAMHFAEQVWPAFVAMLRAELVDVGADPAKAPR